MIIPVLVFQQTTEDIFLCKQCYYSFPSYINMDIYMWLLWYCKNIFFYNKFIFMEKNWSNYSPTVQQHITEPFGTHLYNMLWFCVKILQLYHNKNITIDTHKMSSFKNKFHHCVLPSQIEINLSNYINCLHTIKYRHSKTMLNVQTSKDWKPSRHTGIFHLNSIYNYIVYELSPFVEKFFKKRSIYMYSQQFSNIYSFLNLWIAWTYRKKAWKQNYSEKYTAELTVIH